MAINKAKLANDIRRLAEYMENRGNKCIYARYAPDDLAYVLDRKWIAYRAGILFYSTGWGWRCRKKSHWREVWQGRFGDWPGVDKP